MDTFMQQFYADPLYYIGFIFAFMAAFAMLIFLRGFLSGVGHLTTIDWHDGHMDHYRHRAMWGALSLLAVFIAWEILSWALRGILSFFGVAYL